MVEARWNGTLIASSDEAVVVEGDHYFRTKAVNPDFPHLSDTTANCSWKGNAHYYSLNIDGAENEDAARYNPDPKPKAENIQDRIAFWKGVHVS